MTVQVDGGAPQSSAELHEMQKDHDDLKARLSQAREDREWWERVFNDSRWRGFAERFTAETEEKAEDWKTLDTPKELMKLQAYVRAREDVIGLFSIAGVDREVKRLEAELKEFEAQMALFAKKREQADKADDAERRAATIGMSPEWVASIAEQVDAAELAERGGATAAEVAQELEAKTAAMKKDMAKLAEAGRLEPGERRKCMVTGKVADTWRLVRSKPEAAELPEDASAEAAA